jgi:hypothetical protein
VNSRIGDDLPSFRLRIPKANESTGIHASGPWVYIYLAADGIVETKGSFEVSR